MNHCGSVCVQQTAFKSVRNSRPHGFVTCIPQNKALIFRIGPILKQLGLERLFPVQRFGSEFHTLLRHIETEVAHGPHLSPLADHGAPVDPEDFNMAGIFRSRVLHLPIRGIAKGEFSWSLLNDRSVRQHTRLKIPQVIRIGHNRHHSQRMIGVDQISTRDGFTGLDHRIIRISPCSQHCRKVQFEPLPVIGA